MLNRTQSIHTQVMHIRDLGFAINTILMDVLLLRLWLATNALAMLACFCVIFMCDPDCMWGWAGVYSATRG